MSKLYYLPISFEKNYTIQKGVLRALNQAKISAKTQRFFKRPRTAMVKLLSKVSMRARVTGCFRKRRGNKQSIKTQGKNYKH